MWLLNTDVTCFKWSVHCSEAAIDPHDAVQGIQRYAESMAASTEKAAADIDARQTVLSMSADQVTQVADLLRTVRETVKQIAAGPEPAPEPQKSEKTGKALTLLHNDACCHMSNRADGLYIQMLQPPLAICLSLVCSTAGRREKNSNAAAERERAAASTSERPPSQKAQAKAPHPAAPKRETKPLQSHKLTVSGCYAGDPSSAFDALL